MTVYITGYSGFVGSYLGDYLSVRDMTVIGVSRQPMSDKSKHPTISYQKLEEIAGKGDLVGATIVHCAGRAHVMNEQAGDPESEYFSVNADLTKKVRDIALMGKARQMIFLSSIKVNGEVSAVPMSADDEPQPEDSYGRSKLAGEEVLRQAFDELTLFTIIRLPLVYGPGVKGNLAALEKALVRGLPLPFASISNKRDMVSLQNLSSFIVHCIGRAPAASGVWMLSDCSSLSTPQICRLMATGLGVRGWLFPMPKVCLSLLFKMLGKNTLTDRLLGNLEVDCSKTIASGWRPEQSPGEGFIEMFKASSGRV